MGLGTALAVSVDHATPLGNTAVACLRETLARGWAELDDAAVIKTYQSLAAADGQNGGAPRAEPGYQPGVIGRIAEMRARYYSAAEGFGQRFERQVATDVAEFASRLGRPRNGLWTAMRRAHRRVEQVRERPSWITGRVISTSARPASGAAIEATT